jgi:sugar/nucleoside kinase (ribokinase family)
MGVRYVISGGIRTDHVITADGAVHLSEMGGSATYAAAGAGVWTREIGLVGRAGRAFRTRWIRQLARLGFDVAGVHRFRDQVDTPAFYAYLDPETRVDTDPAGHFARVGAPLPAELKDYVHSTPGHDQLEFRTFSPRPEDVPPGCTSARSLHLAPMGLMSHLSLAKAFKARGCWVSADPGERYMVPHVMGSLRELFAHLDAFLPSEMEVRSLLGDMDLWEAAEWFAAAGPSVVIIKVGKRGALVFERASGRRTTVPPYPGTVVDVTGAGDAFCGGFMVGMAETGDPLRAAHYGAVSSSFVLQGFGALYATRFGRQDAEARLKEMRGGQR